MSDPDTHAELTTGFRRLRPVIHSWLARDLTGPPADSTRAYADLTLAFGFARLGAAEDARQLVREAATVLQAAGSEVHVRLLRMYEWRIEEALAGRAPHGLFPDGIRPPRRSESPTGRRLTAEYQEPSRVWYDISQRHGRSRILDPEGCVNVYAEWTYQSASGWPRQVGELHEEHNRAEIERRLRALLQNADSFTPPERLHAWSSAFPFARRLNPETIVDLVLAVPHVVEPVFSTAGPEVRDWAARLLGDAVSCFAGSGRESEPFPPLLDSVVELIRAAPLTARRDDTDLERQITLIRLGWPCLRWFRQLDTKWESVAFLDRTRGLWPIPESEQPDRNLPARDGSFRTAALEAVFRAYAEEPDQAEALLNRVEQELTRLRAARTRTRPGDIANLTSHYAQAVATRSPTEALPQFERLFAELTRLPNTYTTARLYSRLHLELLESALLGFPSVGDF